MKVAALSAGVAEAPLKLATIISINEAVLDPASGLPSDRW
jgi:hypothetical protein